MWLTMLSLMIDAIPCGMLAAILILPLRRRLFGSARRCLACMLFSLYLLSLFSLTGIPSVSNLTFDPSFNLVPLAGIVGDLRNAALNVLLFVPLGILLPLLWREFRSLPRAALAGLLLSLAIESLQIFTFRLTDVNDLITNTLGTLLGFLPVKLLLAKGTGYAGRPAVPELPILLGLSFGLAFLAQPLISSAIWGIIYK